jgi:hypothetical protein
MRGWRNHGNWTRASQSIQREVNCGSVGFVPGFVLDRDTQHVIAFISLDQAKVDEVLKSLNMVQGPPSNCCSKRYRRSALGFAPVTVADSPMVVPTKPGDGCVASRAAVMAEAIAGYGKNTINARSTLTNSLRNF